MAILESLPNSTRRQKISILLILLISLILSLYYVLPRLTNSTDFGHDEGNYIRMAQQLVDCHIYGYNSAEPNAFVPPGLPVYLALCYKLFGFSSTGFAIMRLLQVIYTVFTVYLTYVFAFLLSKNHKRSLLSSLLIALNLNFYSYTFAFLTENLYFLLLMLFCVVFVKANQSRKLSLYIISGIIFCCCVMTRSAVVSILPFIFIPTFLRKNESTKKSILFLFSFLCSFVVIALPWWIRNYILFDKFIPFCHQSHIVYEGLAKNIYQYGYGWPASLKDHLIILADLLKNDFVGTIQWNTIGKFREIFLQYDNSLNSSISLLVSGLTLFCGFPVLISKLFSRKSLFIVLPFFVYLITIFCGVPTQRYGLQFMFFLSIGAAELLSNISFAFTKEKND